MDQRTEVESRSQVDIGEPELGRSRGDLETKETELGRTRGDLGDKGNRTGQNQKGFWRQRKKSWAEPAETACEMTGR